MKRRRSPAEPSRPRPDRRADLLDAAHRAIRRHGPGVSMEQMAAEAGVTKPILYRHVGGRQELTSALAIRFADELLGSLDGALASGAGPRELLVATVDAYLSLIEREPELYRFLVHRVSVEQEGAHEALTGLIDEIGRRIALVVGEQLRAAGLDSGPAEPWAYGLVGMVHIAGDWWIERRTLPRARLVEYLTALVWDGLGSLPLADAQTPLRLIEEHNDAVGSE